MRILRVSLRIAALGVLAGIAAALVAAPVLSQGGQREVRSAANKSKRSKATARNADAERSPAPEEAVGKDAEEEAAAAREREEWAAFQRQLADGTAAIANHGLTLTYATIALVVVSASLWLMAFLQARDLKAAVRAVQESSGAARSSTEFMQRALVLCQRATVIASEPTAVWLRDARHRLVGCRLLVTWHNVGTTPTRNMIAAVAGLATDRPPSRTGAFPDASARQQPVMMGPNAAINSAYVNLPIGLVADILERRAYYQLAGWAEYNDVFDNTPRHRVEFCYWVEFEGDLESDRLEARFHIHGTHNRHCDSGVGNGGVRPSAPDTVAEPRKVQYGVGPSGSETVAEPVRSHVSSPSASGLTP